MRSSSLAVVLIFAAVMSSRAEGIHAEITIVDQSKNPVSGVVVRFEDAHNALFSGITDDKGRIEFTGLTPGRFTLTATKSGFEPLQQRDLDLSSDKITLELTLSPVSTRRDSVDVQGDPSPMDQGSSAPNAVPTQIASQLPGRPATVTDALPLVPGVARTPGGGLQISGSGEHRSALIVNSADVTDPATGQFGLTVPIDQVESLNVYQTPFQAEYGRFTAGLVSVETRRGGDKWKFEFNDPFPEWRIRSWQLRGLRTATPRLNFQGPLIAGRLYISEGFEFDIRKTEVFTLPFPNNQKKQEGVNSFTQLDWVASPKHLLTATMHIAPSRLDYVNMDYFNPQQTTPDASLRNYTGTIGDRLTLGGGLLDNTLSVTNFDANVWGHGPQDFVVAPWGNTGDYFAQQQRNSQRASWLSTYSFVPLNVLGTHNFKVGSYVAGSASHGRVTDHPIDILGPSAELLERITFQGGRPFQMSDMEFAFFGEDHWNVSPRLALDLGMRAESQQLSETIRLAPRAGVAWTPFKDSGTVVRAGVGLFYDRVPLNVYSFGAFPNPVITTYDPSGQIATGPILYQNVLGEVVIRSPFIFQELTAGNFSPRSRTWSAQVEQPIATRLKLRIGYMQNQSEGLVTLNPVAPDPATNIGSRVLSGSGRSSYRQFEATAKLRLTSGGQLFFSYVRSRAVGDLNDFSTYLGSFPAAIVRPNQYSTLPTDMPNRFLTWGLVQLPWQIRIAPTVEYRSGFPYLVTDPWQNYVGAPYQSRFPRFLSVDARVSKDIKVSPKYSVRFSVSSYNLTNHYNPEAVHNNLGDAAYGYFFGQRGRRFTADFDVLF
jgi:hypothetical protein